MRPTREIRKETRHRAKRFAFADRYVCTGFTKDGHQAIPLRCDIFLADQLRPGAFVGGFRRQSAGYALPYTATNTPRTRWIAQFLGSREKTSFQNP